MSQQVVRVTEQTTKAEIEQALANHVATLRRWPMHWTDQRNRMHTRIDALLDDWERAPESETPGAEAG